MNVLDDLLAVLDEEQRCLLTGDYGSLEELIARKTDLAERIVSASVDLPEAAVARVKLRAGQNDELLRAARRGIGAAISELRQLAEANGMSTYQRDGERRTLSRPTSSVTHRM